MSINEQAAQMAAYFERKAESRSSIGVYLLAHEVQVVVTALRLLAQQPAPDPVKALREENDRLKKALVLLALPAEVMLAVHADGAHIAPTAITAFWKGVVAVGTALAQTEAQPAPQAQAGEAL